MSEEKEKQETRYPLRSLHDFLYELDKEWDRFRTGSLIGLVVSGVLLLFSFTRLFAALRNRAVFELVFMLVVIAALVYTVSALLAQHRFFKRWERRIGLLLHTEEKILGEELEKDSKPHFPIRFGGSFLVYIVGASPFICWKAKSRLIKCRR